MNRANGSSRASVLLLCLALVAGAFFAWPTIGTEEELEAPKDGELATPEPAEVVPAIPSPTEFSPNGATGGRTKAAPGGAEELLSIPLETPEILGLSGRVKMVGDGAVDATELDGQISATLRGESTSPSLFVDVEDGRFRLTFRTNSNGELMDPDGGVLAEGIRPGTDGLMVAIGRPTFHLIGNMAMAGADGNKGQANLPTWPFGTEDAVIYVTRGAGARLHIVDKETGAPLGGVKVVRAKSGFSYDHPLGIETISLTGDESSPVYVSAQGSSGLGESTKVFICAAGHAWTTIRLDLRTDSTRTVELARAGTLRVSVGGDVPKAGRLNLYRASGYEAVSSTAFTSEEPVVFENLKADEYIVRVELGPPQSGAKLLADEIVVLGYGADKTVHLRADAVIVAPRAKASGVLVVPSAWELDGFRATFTRFGASSDGSKQELVLSQADFDPILGDPGAYAFQLPAMEVGAYELSLAPIDWKQIYELPPEGRRDLRFVLSQPVDLTVYVADDKTSEPATDVDNISWNPKWPAESRSGSSKSERVSDDPGVFRFQVTEGIVDVSCSDGGYAYQSVKIDTRNTSEVTLRMVRPSRASVILKDGEQVVPWPGSINFDVEAMPGTNGNNNSSGSGSHTPPWFGVSSPGRYRLILPDINGFEPHEPVEFEMLKGEHIEIVVHLVKR